MQARTAILVSALCVWAMAALGPLSRACSCLQSRSTPEEALLSYDVVFLGRALAITGRETPDAEMVDGVDVTLRVLESWKGGSSPGDRLVVRTNTNSASCGFPFQVGSTFLVWARASSGVLTTHLCDRTEVTNTAKTDTDLRHLRDLAETWTWRRVQADGFTLLLPKEFVPDPTPFDLPEDVAGWQTIWWKPLDPLRSGGWSHAGRKISYEYLGPVASPSAPPPKVESTVAGKPAAIRHVALPDGRRVMSVYWVGTEVLAMHCDVDPAHDVCDRVLESLQW